MVLDCRCGTGGPLSGPAAVKSMGKVTERIYLRMMNAERPRCAKAGVRGGSAALCRGLEVELAKQPVST